MLLLIHDGIKVNLFFNLYVGWLLCIDPVIKYATAHMFTTANIF